ncbi:MAG: hypothetical protein NTU50_07870 [Actinobacteria bacterium]|nr:hypothetical protein [Actinomycetota bacterium]
MDGGPGDGETAWIVPRSEEGNKANPLSKGRLFSPNYPLRDHENAASAIARIRVEAGQRAQDKNIGYREAMTEIQTPSIPLPQFPRTTPMSPGTDFDEDPSDQAIINKDRIDQDRWNKSFHSPLMKRMEAQDVAIESGGAYDAVLDPAELVKLVGGQLDYLFDNTRGSGHSFNFRQQIAQEIKRREGEDKAYDGADYDRYKPRGADGLVDLALMADRFGFEPTPPQSPGADGSIPTGSDQLNSMLAQVAAKKEAKAQPLASGDRVEDPDSGRTGTYQRGRMTGEPSVVWDDTPDSAEFYYEGELVPLPKAPMSPGTEKSMYDGTPRDKRGMAFDMSDAELLGTGSPVIGRDFKARPITPKEYQAALKHVTSLYFDETASLTEAAVAQELARTQRKLARQKPGARDKDLEETAELLETLLEDVSEADPQD